jgi:hypothetical protein
MEKYALGDGLIKTDFIDAWQLHALYVCAMSYRSKSSGHTAISHCDHRSLDNPSDTRTSQSSYYTVMILESLLTGFGLVTGFTEHLQIVTTSNYSTIANSHTHLKFTTARTKSSQSAAPSPVVAW